MRRSLLLAVLALVALAAGLVFGRERGLFVQGWLVCVTAVATLTLLDHWSRALPRTARLEELVPPARGRGGRIDQLEALRRQLIQARVSGLDLHRFFRPNVTEIVAVRLARRHGVDLAAEPERARTLVRPHVWELVRPDRARPTAIGDRGWPLRRLESLLRELEEI